MNRKDYDTLHQCVTELCFPLMTEDLKMCTTRWQFLKSLEPPRVVHARCTDIINKENIFSQVCPLNCFRYHIWVNISFNRRLRFVFTHNKHSQFMIDLVA